MIDLLPPEPFFYRHVYQELYSILNSRSLDALKADLDTRRAAYFTGTFGHGCKYSRNLHVVTATWIGAQPGRNQVREEYVLLDNHKLGQVGRSMYI